VTGTLVSGSVGPGDEVELFPGGARLRVRGVHSAGKAVERATPGQRTAVNLAGIEYTALERGMVLATPGKFRMTRRMDVRLELLGSARKMKQGARVHFHAGTAETIAEVFFQEQKELPPGSSVFANLKLQEAILLLPADHFIVRQFSPVVTIGGGTVLDPLARRLLQRDTGRIAYLETLERGNREEILAAMTERAIVGLGYEEIVARSAWMDQEIRETAKRLSAAGRVKTVSTEPLVLVSGKVFAEVQKRILEKVEKFQKENPLLPGILREDLRSSLGKRVRAETFRRALEELAEQKKLDAAGELVKKAGSEITLQAEEAKAKDQMEAAFRTAGLEVPSVKEVLGKLAIEAKRAERLLQILLREKDLVRVSLDLIFHRDALAQLKQRLAGYKESRGERISVPAFKELTGITRKYAIPLLEYLDRERVTRRAGDDRVIL
jgi:selenocysteine-specific elongation factor